MTSSSHEKVTTSHLSRDAWLYVRQSTLHQVFENTESTQRQYALRQKAVALGWPVEQVQVIDCDLGQSAASVVDREGFQQLVTEVSMGRAGIVLGLEVSRLARNSCDWHRLLEICAVTRTLILDEEGLYDPGNFNDRLLLGLKGAMSEAELHIMRCRLQGNLESKARRGELKLPLPTGLEYNAAGHVALDPDQQVQQSFRTFFETFERSGTACATVKYFRQQGLTIPRRLRRGERKGELTWVELDHARALKILHNPRYGGAYVRGRTQTSKDVEGRSRTRHVPREKWQVLLPDSHPGYITWDQFEQNQQRLLENSQAYGGDRQKSPPREGPALLQGLAVCGCCGQPMTIRYRSGKTGLRPQYVCQRDAIARGGEPACQSIPGRSIDEAIGELLLELISPLTLEIALEVQTEFQARLQEADRIRQQHVERARYEANLARQRFMQVDPNNRLVADSLEADWNDKLRSLIEAQQEYERQREQDRLSLSDEQRDEVLSLVEDFPRLWRDERTPDGQRKRMVRLLIEDATLIKAAQLTVHVRLKGGATRTLALPLPQPACRTWQTDPAVVKQVDALLNDFTGAEVAKKLNAQGLQSGKGGSFKRMTVYNICQSYGLKSHYQRLRERGFLTRKEMASALGISKSTVSAWKRAGLLKAKLANDKGQCLYEPVSPENRPEKRQGRKLNDRREQILATK